MRVSELAARAGVTREVVRYYTRLGLIRADKEANGYHTYDERGLRYLQFIGKAKQLGFTLKQIKEILLQVEQGESPCQRVRSMLQHRIRETQQKIEELSQLQSRMEQAVTQWQRIPDSTPDDDTFCVLIESVQAIAY